MIILFIYDNVHRHTTKLKNVQISPTPITVICLHAKLDKYMSAY